MSTDAAGVLWNAREATINAILDRVQSGALLRDVVKVSTAESNAKRVELVADVVNMLFLDGVVTVRAVVRWNKRGEPYAIFEIHPAAAP